MERTRAALIASARHVFATRGFEGASLDEIADAAGYTRGAIYRHFANKEDLFFAVSDAVNTEVLDTFAEELDLEETSALDDNRPAAATWMKALAGNREIWALNLELSLYEYRNPGVQERSADQRRQNRAMVTVVHGALLGRTRLHPQVSGRDHRRDPAQRFRRIRAGRPNRHRRRGAVRNVPRPLHPGSHGTGSHGTGGHGRGPDPRTAGTVDEPRR